MNQEANRLCSQTCYRFPPVGDGIREIAVGLAHQYCRHVEMAPTFKDSVEKYEKHLLRDPEIKTITKERVQSVIREYKSLLDNCGPEQDIHNLIQNNSFFFSGLMRMHGQSPLYSKIRLGSDYVTDFVYFDLGSFGPDWKLIEIEVPSAKLFTKRGDPTAEFNHAIQQVRDWQDWLVENIDNARKLMPGIHYPFGYLFIGRRSELTPENKKKMKRISYDCRSFAHIHTLDRLADWASFALTYIKDEGGGSWTVPLRAYSHKDLVEQKPPETFYWLSRHLTTLFDPEYYREWHSWDYPGSDYRENERRGDPEY